jgi:hypothetical protein
MVQFSTKVEERKFHNTLSNNMKSWCLSSIVFDKMHTKFENLNMIKVGNKYV